MRSRCHFCSAALVHCEPRGLKEALNLAKLAISIIHSEVLLTNAFAARGFSVMAETFFNVHPAKLESGSAVADLWICVY